MCGIHFTTKCDFLVIEMGKAFDKKGENIFIDLLTLRKKLMETL